MLYENLAFSFLVVYKRNSKTGLRLLLRIWEFGVRILRLGVRLSAFLLLFFRHEWLVGEDPEVWCGFGVAVVVAGGFDNECVFDRVAVAAMDWCWSGVVAAACD
ncbi:hypothetical protein TSUD_275820 [Trifolium subterraneum]|uniref:Uncharacterized protein n=1 Tax=Trifolium subterraneum TaxID=3900 RepID=A0A2Z6MH50_TRISU|nr:hypothetical protein TSUD_275820 [Trifolium subterraneum]